jgi:hypothetical protein
VRLVVFIVLSSLVHLPSLPYPSHREWRVYATQSLKEIDHSLRADIAARDSRADARAEKIKAQRKADRMATKRR